MLKTTIGKRSKSIMALIVSFTFVFFCIAVMTNYCLAADTWKEVKDLKFKANLVFSEELTGTYNQGKFDYDENKGVKITATGNLCNIEGEIIKSFTDLQGVLVQDKEQDYFQFDIDQWRVQTYDKGWGSNREIITKVLMRSSMSTQGKIQQKSTQSILPPFTLLLKGNNEVRVSNPNDFEVTVGLRTGKSGKDFHVASNGVASVFAPDGAYEIYFVYSSKPDALFQGDDFSLNKNGIEIKIVKVVGGNYGIKQVK